MKLRTIKSLILLLFVGTLFSGCNDLKNMVKKHPTDAKYVATPNPLEMHGDKVKVSIEGTYNPKYFSKKAGVVFQPELRYEGGSTKLKPILIQGESAQLNGAASTINKEKGGTFKYEDTFDYKPEMEQSKLVVNPTVFPAKKAKDKDIQSILTAVDSIGKSAKLGEKPLADGINTTSNMVQNEAKPSFEKDKYQKETFSDYKATIFFVVDQSKLDWNWKPNKIEENKAALRKMDTLLASNMELQSIKISAWASPEGEESRNQNLSTDRAKTADKYLNDQYNKAIKARAKAEKKKEKDIRKDLNISTEAKGEDWDGFLTALKASNIPEKNTIINVISSHTDHEARQQEIRNMTVIYKQIEDSILPPLRRSEITATYKDAKKTDEQIAALSTSHPDSLDVEELLYSATLTEDNATKLQIYTSASNVYADDWRGYNNAAFVAINMKDYDNASQMLEKGNGIQPNNGAILNNLGVVTLAKGDFKNAKAYFESAQKAGNAEAKSNLGILAIKDGDYAGAASAMSNETCTHNLALAQIMNKDIASAKTTLACAPQDAVTFYLLAICAARENNAADVNTNLQKACAADASYKQKAKNDVEFIKFNNTAEFLNAIK